MNIETLSGLESCSLFAGISREEIMNMMHSVHYRVVSYQRGEIIALAGTPCSRVDIIVSGEVIANLMGPSGRIIRITMHHSGNIIAPAFLFARDNNYPVTVEATKETQVLRLQAPDINHLIESDHRIARNYIRIVSNIVSFLTKKVAMLSMNAREKVSLYLKEESLRQNSRRVFIDMTRQELANHFGIQKYSLIRCLKEMQKEGEIQVEGKYIELLP